LSYDQFLNAAIANNCCKDIIIELFKILTKNSVKLRRFNIYNRLNHHPENLDNLGYSVLPHFSECISIFSRLNYFNCSYQWPMEKTQLFNAIAEECHNIENLKISIYYENEGIALAALIRSQKRLKKFSLINSNNFASFPVQALMNQTHSLKSLAFEDMHCDRNLSKTKFFKYAICQLTSSAINVITQCIKINKLKFDHCEGLNSTAFFPLATAFSNLTSLEYSYGAYKIYDRATPIILLSGLIMANCNTLKRIILDWHSRNFLDITQLVKIIAQQVISLEHLKIPIYTLEQLALIHRTHNNLRNLEIHMDRTINPYCALSLFANASLKSIEHSIKLHFDYNEISKLKFNISNQIFESIFYKSNRVVDFVLCLQSMS
ncbi:8512_t:CDS:2, partial [Racocetra persica]